MISIFHYHCVEESRKSIEEAYRASSDPRPFLQQSRDAIAECRRTIAAGNRQLEKARIWRGPIKGISVSSQT
jgi:hypothetical protein